MSPTQIWLPLMEVMARSSDVVVLVGPDQMVCEVVSILTVSSALVATEARGASVTETLGADLAGALAVVDSHGSQADRPVEMHLGVTDPRGRLRDCRCTVVELPASASGARYLLLALSEGGRTLEGEGSLSHRALHDQLTGLLNRAAFLDRLDHSMMGAHGSTTPGHPVVVMFIDLDEFKPINDRFGHEVGDAMLAEIARRIAAVAGRGDTVARLGGDEFAILIDQRDVTQGPRRVGHDRLDRGIDLAQRVLESIAAPLRVAGVSATISASIGLAVAGPESTTGSVLRDADLAMYEAKRSGRSQIRIFDPAMRQRANLHVAYRRELPSAIGRGQLGVVYLPHCDVRSGEILGWEALVRWEHPELGTIEPEEFVPIAERAGVMGEIGTWVRETALRAFANLVALEPAGASRPFLSLNLSRTELLDPSGAERILAEVAGSGVPATRIVCEIPESALELADGSMTGALERLRAAGVRIALDDVGAEGSTVHLLHRAPVDIVKLAPPIVATAPEGDEGLAAAFVELCRRRNLWVIAEGVETVEVRTALIGLGCVAAHGRLIAPPSAHLGPLP